MGLKAIFDPYERLLARIRKTAEDPDLPSDLRPFYERPMPAGRAGVWNVPFTSIDFETTGLDFNSDIVISIGGVSFDGPSIDYETAFHALLKVDGSKIKAQSAIVNMITPEQLCSGEEPREAMLRLMDRLAGGIVLTHCAVIEYTFLKKTLGLPERFELPMAFADTMQLERAITGHREGVDVRLSAIRQRRGLPSYEAHNACADSIATAEVFLAQSRELFRKRPPSVAEVFRRSH
jgi:DNA polymerase-3 subunit epsilon